MTQNNLFQVQEIRSVMSESQTQQMQLMTVKQSFFDGMSSRFIP